jgi:y4mF family transcriptional regulator
MPAAANGGELGAAIRAARRAQGLSQAELAERAGVGRQWLVAVEKGHERAEVGKVSAVLAALDLQLTVSRATPRTGTDPTWLTARDASAAIRDELDRGDPEFALRILARALADLRRLIDSRDVAAFLAPPPSTGDHRWDTLLAAAVGRVCRQHNIHAPEWTDVPPLGSWWFPMFDAVLTARTMQRTPVDFVARGIWLDERALAVA